MESLVLITALLINTPTLTVHSTQRCSQISIESASKVDPGTPVVLRALVKDVSPTQVIAYKWKVSAGTITSGEETATVTVDTTGLGGQSITATVEVLTRENTCSGSKRVDIAPPPPVDGHFDEYGDIKFVSEAARLDNFAIQLMNVPTARGVILTFAGNPTYKGEASYRLRRAKNYLVNVRGIPSSKVMTVDAGYRNDLTTILIVVPSGATFSPSAFTVGEPLKEIRFTKKPPRSFSRSSKRRRPTTQEK
jgi:hypothetical protein